MVGEGVLFANSFPRTSADLCHSANQVGAILSNRRQVAGLGLKAKGRRRRWRSLRRAVGGEPRRPRRRGPHWGSAERAPSASCPSSSLDVHQVQRKSAGDHSTSLDPLDPSAAKKPLSQFPGPAGEGGTHRTAGQPAQPQAPGTWGLGPLLPCRDSQVVRPGLKSYRDTYY